MPRPRPSSAPHGRPRDWQQLEADDRRRWEAEGVPRVVDSDTGSPALDATTSSTATANAATAAAARHKRQAYQKRAQHVYASEVDKVMFEEGRLSDGSRAFLATDLTASPAEDISLRTAYNHTKASGVYGNPNAGVTVNPQPAWADYSAPDPAQAGAAAKKTKKKKKKSSSKTKKSRSSHGSSRSARPVDAFAVRQLSREPTPRGVRQSGDEGNSAQLPVGDTELMRRALAFKRTKTRLEKQEEARQRRERQQREKERLLRQATAERGGKQNGGWVLLEPAADRRTSSGHPHSKDSEYSDHEAKIAVVPPPSGHSNNDDDDGGDDDDYGNDGFDDFDDGVDSDSVNGETKRGEASTQAVAATNASTGEVIVSSETTVSDGVDVTNDEIANKDTTGRQKRRKGKKASRSGKKGDGRKSKKAVLGTGILAGLVNFSFFDDPANHTTRPETDDVEDNEDVEVELRRLQRQRKARKAQAFLNTQWGVSVRTRELAEEEAKEEKKRARRSREQLKKIRDKDWKPWREKPPKAKSRGSRHRAESEHTRREQADYDDVTGVYQTHLAQSVGTRTAESTPSSAAGRHHRRHSSGGSNSVFSEFSDGMTPTHQRTNRHHPSGNTPSSYSSGSQSRPSSSRRSAKSRRKRGGFASREPTVDPKWVCTICHSVMRLRSRHLQHVRDERCCGQCARKILRAAQLLYGRHTYPDIRSLQKMTARAIKRLVTAIQLTPAEFRKDRAARRIQIFIRRMASGREARIERRRHRAGEIVVAACRHLMRLRQQRLLAEKGLQVQSVIRLQSKMREMLVRLAAARLTVARDKARVLLQSQTRSYLARTAFQRRKQAATRIQRKVRHRQWLWQREAAARKVQKAFRQFQQRQFGHTMLLQAVWRGILTRSQYREPLRRHKAAVAIQAALRRFFARRAVERVQDSKLNRWRREAATRIQCMMRQRYARQLFDHLKIVFLAASCIQAHTRGFVFLLLQLPPPKRRCFLDLALS